MDPDIRNVFFRYFEDSDFRKKMHIDCIIIHLLSSEASFQPSVP